MDYEILRYQVTWFDTNGHSHVKTFYTEDSAVSFAKNLLTNGNSNIRVVKFLALIDWYK